MSNLYSLHCQWFETQAYCDSAVGVTAHFTTLIPVQCNAEQVAEALRRIGMMLCSGPIDLVQSADKPRCFYCGSLNDADRNTCSQCGGSL